MQTGSSGTLIGWKSGQTTFVPLWDWMEGAWLRTLKSTVSNVFVLLGHFSGRFGHVRVVHYVQYNDSGWWKPIAWGRGGRWKKLTKPEKTLLNQRYEKFFVVWRIFMYNLKTAVWSKLYKKVVFKPPLEVWRRDIKVVKVVYKQYNRWRQL
jgi:hypothetical protein